MTDSLQDLALMVKRLQMRHHRGANEALAPLGISLVQWDALRHLHRNPGASLHDLAVLTFQTDQSFGTLATRLITRGLIERVPGPGRAVHHRLTGKGDKLRQAGSELFNGVLASSFAPLSSEQRADLGALLHELLDQPGENGNPGGAEKSA
jgi:DNA-binding MarR family transcriptional regulator